jgi:phospholipase C
MLAALQVFAGLPVPAYAQSTNPETYATKTPIKHVIVIIGENRTFDHVFATYKPKAGEHVSNLLSKGIIEEDGTPGPNFSLATQHNAEDDYKDPYEISLPERASALNG